MWIPNKCNLYLISLTVPNKGMIFHNRVPTKCMLFQNTVPTKGIVFHDTVPIKGNGLDPFQ